MIGLMLEDEEANALSLLLSIAKEVAIEDISVELWSPTLQGVVDKLEAARVDASTDLYLYEVNQQFEPYVQSRIDVHTQEEAAIIERNFLETGYRTNPV